MKSRTTHSPARVQALLAELEQSGLPVSQFAQRKRMPSTTIYNWLHRKKQREQERRAFLPAVIQPESVEEPACADNLRLHLGSGKVLEIPSGISPQWLSDLLRRIG